MMGRRSSKSQKKEQFEPLKSLKPFTIYDCKVDNWEDMVIPMFESIWFEDPSRVALHESFLNYIFYSFSTFYCTHPTDVLYQSDIFLLEDYHSSLSDYSIHFNYATLFGMLIDLKWSDNYSNLKIQSSSTRSDFSCLNSSSIRINNNNNNDNNQLDKISNRSKYYSPYHSTTSNIYYHPSYGRDISQTAPNIGITTTTYISSSEKIQHGFPLPLIDIIRKTRTTLGVIITAGFLMKKFSFLAQEHKILFKNNPRKTNYQEKKEKFEYFCEECELLLLQCRCDDPKISVMVSDDNNSSCDNIFTGFHNKVCNNSSINNSYVFQNRYMKYLQSSFPFSYFSYSHNLELPGSNLYIPSTSSGSISVPAVNAAVRRRFFLLILIFILVATKLHQDRHYSNQVYAQVASLDLELINAAERMVMNAMGFDFCIDKDCQIYQDWYCRCLSYLGKKTSRNHLSQFQYSQIQRNNADDSRTTDLGFFSSSNPKDESSKSSAPISNSTYTYYIQNINFKNKNRISFRENGILQSAFTKLGSSSLCPHSSIYSRIYYPYGGNTNYINSGNNNNNAVTYDYPNKISSIYLRQ